MKTNVSKILNAAIFGILFITNAFAQKDSASEISRSLGDFSQIKVGDANSIKIKQGEENVAIISVKKNKHDLVLTEIKGNTLSISTKKGIKEEDDLAITIVFKNLSGLELSGAADVKSDGTIKSEKFDLDLSGAGNANLNIDVTDLTSKISGAGDAKLSGNAINHTIKISGAGELKAQNLKVDNASISISGAGDAKIDVVKKLDGSISGAGNIYYLTEPENKTVEISGAGSIRKIKSGTSDTTQVKLGKSKIFIVDGEDNDSTDNCDDHDKKCKKTKNKFNGHWAGLDLGLNNYISRSGSMNTPAGYSFLDIKENKSFGVGLNLMEKNFNLYKNNIGIVTGLGFRWNNYRFDKNINLISDSNTITAINEPILNYQKNKLTSTYLTIPLLLEFQTKNNSHGHNFHMNMGGIFGLRLTSHTKQVYVDGGNTMKIKDKDDFHLSPYQAELTARLGWGPINLFATYSLIPMFEKNEGPEIFPVMAGITLVGF